MRSTAVTLGLTVFIRSALAITYDVSVGPEGQIAYVPPYVHAVAGDVVRFHFNPKNHTVTQSSFSTPCVGLPEGTGFRTGFIPVAAGEAYLPYRDFPVTAQNQGTPLWFYCGQTGHCGQGMVFAINPPAPPAPNSFEAFRAAAIAQGGATAPPAPTPTTPPSGPTSATPASTAADGYVTPPPPKWTATTATVTWGGSVYATTYNSYEGSAQPTPGVTPREHRIIVGEDGRLDYRTANITALINDVVVFEFRPKNHTVTQSSFSTPCQGLPDGFKSGFQPVAADAAAPFPVFSIKINDTAPIWGYCGQVNHCQSGMVFSINAVESGPNNFAAFKQLAQRPITSAGSTGGTSGDNGGANNEDDTGSGSENGNGAGALSPALPMSMFTILVIGFASLGL